MDLALQILGWVALAFLAGFIGQFGKSLTERLLARRRERRDEARPGAPEPLQALEAAPAGDKERAKIEKKQAKAEYKRRKKQG